MNQLYIILMRRLFCLLALSSLLFSSENQVLANPQLIVKVDQEAKAGKPLRVVFLGGSLTWGANATDPQLTSYRALVGEELRKVYPATPVHIWDAAIGGTGSQLGVFRLERDVLSRDPDLVFLDFTANDNIRTADPERLASYEAIVRTLLKEKIAVVIVALPFRSDVEGELPPEKLPGWAAHRRIAQVYGIPFADCVSQARAAVRAGEAKIQELWPFDGAHPDDAGYALFASEIWRTYLAALVDDGKQTPLPESMYPPTYLSRSRVRLSTLTPLPRGWSVKTASRTSAWFDGMPSRWLDDVVVAERKKVESEPEPFEITFVGTTIQVFGEETLRSGRYRATIDGAPIRYPKNGIISASSKRHGGTRQHFQPLASGLAPGEHVLRIMPLLEPEQELRIESVCVAGPGAAIVRNQ